MSNVSKVLGVLIVLASLSFGAFAHAAVGTVKTRCGDAGFVTHVPKARTQVAAVLYALTDDIDDAARCPVAKLNERGYGVIVLDCTKLSGDKESWAAAIKGAKAALKDDVEIDAEAIGVILDKVEPGWDEKDENWMALADSYDRKGWNADPSKVAQTRPFKVMAWNLEGNSESEKELKSLTDLLKDINPDVVLISENYGKLPRIVSLMGGGWSGKSFSMNLAILSRWPIVKTACPYEAPWNYLDPTGPFNFGLAELVVDGQRVRACPLWLNWEHGTPRFSNPRDEEMSGILAAIKREIQESEEIPLVIGGDFNGYVEPHEKMMAAIGFTDTYRRFHPELNGTNVWSWASRDGRRREFVDYIFSKGTKLNPLASESFHSPWHQPFEYGGRKYASFPSDHGFILTTFDLSRPAPPRRSFKVRGRADRVAAISVGGWKGETVSFRFDQTSVEGGMYAPKWEKSPVGWETKGGVMRGVHYMTKVHGTEYAFAPDRVEWNGVTNLPPNGSCIAVGQVKIPADAKAGDYEISFGGRAVKLHVVDRTLPPPKDWRTFTTGYWHHPWALARVSNTRLWSKEHFDFMRPFMAYTAALGVRTIMTTICDLPWNHQCYDPNWTMIRHVKNGGCPGFGGTGEWSFDYTVFDKWVEFNLETGNGPCIYCYSLCPWDHELWYHDESGRPWHFNAKPGTKEYDEYWTPFLIDFRKHLIEKGWFDKVYLASDERDPADVKACMDLLRRVTPDFQVNASGNGDPAVFKGFKLGTYDQILTTIDDDFLARARQMIAEGRKVLYYVCCSPLTPNTFVGSDPDDAFWLPVFAAAKGLSGFGRWTFDSFPEDAMTDATYACWPSGDTFFAYPNGDPTWRYLGLLNGYQNGEKWRILAAEGGETAAELEKLGKRYDVQQALNKKDGDFRELVADTLEILNR